MVLNARASKDNSVLAVLKLLVTSASVLALRNFNTYCATGSRSVPSVVNVIRPPLVPVAATNPLSNENTLGLKPLDRSAYKPKLVAELVIDKYPPDCVYEPFKQKIWKHDTICAYPSLVTSQPVPPNETMVKALATMDLPCGGVVPSTGFSCSISNPGGLMLGSLIFSPSTQIPLPPKNEIIEQFWMYGDNEICGLFLRRPKYPERSTVSSSGSSNATHQLNV